MHPVPPNEPEAIDHLVGAVPGNPDALERMGTDG